MSRKPLPRSSPGRGSAAVTTRPSPPPSRSPSPSLSRSRRTLSPDLVASLTAAIARCEDDLARLRQAKRILLASPQPVVPPAALSPEPGVPSPRTTRAPRRRGAAGARRKRTMEALRRERGRQGTFTAAERRILGPLAPFAPDERPLLDALADAAGLEQW
jgi:hypothetical protein